MIPETGFTLKLDGSPVEEKAGMTVKKLGFTGYHVVQYFKVIKMERGAHILYGETDLKLENNVRKNTVYLTIE